MPLNQSILITGISGFTGIHLAQMLRQDGNQVVGITNVHAQHSEAPNVKKIILASSAAIYGNPVAVDFVSEKQPPAPTSHYGCSKLAMEHIAHNYAEYLPILITRPFNYTGPGQPSAFLIPKIVSHFKNKRETIELGNTAIIREFSDVRDACLNYIELLDQPGTGTVNLCSGIANSFDDVLTTFKALTGHDITVQTNPKFVRKNDIVRLVGDNTNLQKMTGYTPNYSLKQTLSDMLNDA